MNPETQQFLASKFMEYYEKNGSSNVIAPTDLPEREFAFTYFDRDGMFRHKGFSKIEELLSHLRVNGPSHSYLSAAHYLDPGASTMGQKGWKGTDLIFDIDADHLEVPCKMKHDRWVCKDCGRSGKGERPEKCPTCQSTKLEDETWLCDECINQAKLETIKLVDILHDDFGFSKNETEITYTGHRGYHTRIESPKISFLTPSARREIVDYITGRGIDLQAHGLIEQGPESRRSMAGPRRDDTGWGLRIFRSVEKMINDGEAPAELLADKQRVLAGMAEGRWDVVKGVALKKWNKLAGEAINCYGTAHIDEPVTTDIHRLIRLRGSLHGKTGFAVTRVGNLDSFDPFKDAITFKSDEMVTVHIEYGNSFRIGDTIYGDPRKPFKDQTIELPLVAAIFYMCKGVAEIVHEDQSGTKV
jgi:DNA primase small subunit